MTRTHDQRTRRQPVGGATGSDKIFIADKVTPLLCNTKMEQKTMTFQSWQFKMGSLALMLSQAFGFVDNFQPLFRTELLQGY